MFATLSTTTSMTPAAGAGAASDAHVGCGGGAGTLTITALTVACVTLSVIVLAMSLIDLPYFFRSLFSYVSGTCFKKKIRATETAVYSSLCLTTDLDVYLSHMNNARYLREIDLARIEFVLRTGMWHELRRHDALIFTIASNVRYRKFVRTFSRYEIRTRIVYWDDVSLFFEHRFVSKADGFVRAIVYNRQRVVNYSANELMRTLVGTKTVDGAIQRPECPIEIHHWIQSNLMSSANLRAENTAPVAGSDDP
ncbi:HotDog domain [Cinara cedri]|uniref:Protein THEM6 n=1 Tax=Cinara cedri TaxID=506608 RepID=A0A5E4MA17_9HEMI|nr:HotDog domain [Cinara cedri]